MSTKTKPYKLADVAKALNVTPRRIQQLVKESILPAPSARGQYDLAACITAYEQYDDKKPSSKNEPSNLATEKLRLLKAKAEKAELELEALRGRYIEAAEVEFEWSNLLLAFRSKMLSLPSKLVRPLASASSDFAKLEQILEDEIHEALTTLSKYGQTEDLENSEDSSPAT